MKRIAVQYFAKSMDNVQRYHNNDDIQKRYGDRVLTFATLLEEV
jgi:hypothetical protein